MMRETAKAIQKKGILFVTPKDLYRSWPVRSDFTPYVLGFPATTYAQLSAMVPEIKVRFFDGLFNRKTKFGEYIQILSDYPVVCLGVVSSYSSLNADLTVRLIRKHNPQAVIVIGGHHATYYSAEWLARGVDIVVRHEGEYTFQEIIRALAAGEPVSDILGISYRDSSGQIRHNEDRAFLADLDQLPMPDWDILDFSLYPFRLQAGGYPATVETSRGCMHSCSFCLVHTMWKEGQKFKSVERVLAEIEELHRRGVRQVVMADDNFGANVERDMKIFEGIIARDYQIAFGSFIRADTVLNNPDFLNLYIRAGLKAVHIGFETIFEEVLTRYHKGLGPCMTVRDYKEVYRRLHEKGVFVYGGFVSDYDFDLEPKMTQKTRRDLTKICDVIAPCPLIPQEGVPAVDELRNKGYVLKDMFYHDRFFPAFQYRGREQGSSYSLTAILGLLRPSNFYKMLFGRPAEMFFFRSLYLGILRDMFFMIPTGIRTMMLAKNKHKGLNERQREVVDLYLQKYDLTDVEPGR